jgi:hypothetical protein
VASIARLAATRLGLLSTGSPRKTPRQRVGGRAARELGVGGHRWSRGAWRLRSASFAVALATVLILLRLSSSTLALVRYDVASCLAKGPLAVSRLSVCHFASRPRRLGRGALLGDERARGIYGASRCDLDRSILDWPSASKTIVDDDRRSNIKTKASATAKLADRRRHAPRDQR